MKPEYVLLAQTYKGQKVIGWWMSEKLDGTRAIWDGGISRGMLAKDVPYANTLKDSRLLKDPVATGLWSRAGKVIEAPDWWLDKLPKNYCLDGELWMGYNSFQELRKVDKNWNDVIFKVFDCVGSSFFRPRKVTIRGDYNFWIDDCYHWAINKGAIPGDWTFDTNTIACCKRCTGVAEYVEQIRIINQKQIDDYLEMILDKGGEGVMFRKGHGFWMPERSHDLLKYKPFLDDEGIVVGYTYGEGKLLGLMGALIIRSKGHDFKISGFTDAERFIPDGDYAKAHPGEVSLNKHPLHGQSVRYKYRELSDDGVPKEARYWR